MATTGRWLMSVFLFLLLGGVGMGLSAVFTEYPQTHVLHIICGFGLGFVSPIIAIFLFGRFIGAVPGWRLYRNYSLMTAGASILLLLFSFMVFNPPYQIGGLVVRILVIELFAWHAVIGWRLFSLGNRHQAKDAVEKR